MTTARELLHVHSCSYFCNRPECIKAQRNELRDRYAELTNRDRELVKDAVAFLRLNDMHLAAGVVSKYVLGSTE